MRTSIPAITIAAMLLAAPLALPACGGDDDSMSSDPDVLTAPTKFTATYDAGTVHMTWVPGSGQEMFMVMRQEDGTMNPPMTWQVPATETSFDDTSPESGKTYMYMVHAMKGEDISDPSNMVMVAIP